MKIIGLAGRARTGKSTVCMHLVDKHSFGDYAFAEPVKRGLMAMFGLPEDLVFGEDKETVIPWIGRSLRELTQTLGTEWGREMVAPDIWVRCAARWLESVPRYWPGVVFSDVRYEEEAALVRDRGGVIWHVRRDDAPQVRAHSSEAGIEVREGDVVLPNNGSLEELYARIDDLLRGM